MPAPSIFSVSAVATDYGQFVPPRISTDWPAGHQAGDLAFYSIYSKHNAVLEIASGWSVLGAPNQYGENGDLKLTVIYRYANGSAMDPVYVDGGAAGTPLGGYMTVLRGAFNGFSSAVGTEGPSAGHGSVNIQNQAYYARILTFYAMKKAGGSVTAASAGLGLFDNVAIEQDYTWDSLGIPEGMLVGLSAESDVAFESDYLTCSTSGVTIDCYAIVAAFGDPLAAFGDLNKTLGALTLVSDGDVLVKGAAAITLGAVTITSVAARAPAHGDLAKTLDNLTITATVMTSPVGFADITLGALTIASAGVVLIKGELARTLEDLTLSASSSPRITGQLAVTLDDVYTAPTISGAYAIATHTVRVLLSAAPRHVSAYDDGDALNPLTWTVINPLTGFSYTIVGAVMHDDTTVDLSLLEALGSHLESFIVGAANLSGAAGGVSVNLAAQFVGTVQTIDPLQAVTLDRYLDRDLANPPLQTELGGFGGTIRIGDDGDYDTETGVPLVKKLVIRRLSTPRGAFPHLPRYGVGILEKEPIVSSGNLVTLKGEIESQINEEPDVEACRVGLLLDRSNVLQIQVRVKLAGSGATFDMQMHTANGQLVEI